MTVYNVILKGVWDLSKLPECKDKKCDTKISYIQSNPLPKKKKKKIIKAKTQNMHTNAAATFKR